MPCPTRTRWSNSDAGLTLGNVALKLSDYPINGSCITAKWSIPAAAPQSNVRR